jgi:hypothetical protein
LILKLINETNINDLLVEFTNKEFEIKIQKQVDSFADNRRKLRRELMIPVSDGNNKTNE